jgi:surfactin synthase thioesterase subunit/glycosyltransferase involved in cell wall biosynthesis
VRILLGHNSLYYPAHGGGDKSNRLLMEALAALGHQVRVATRVERFGQADHEKLLRNLAQRSVEAHASAEGTISFQRNGVDVCVLSLNSQLRSFFFTQIEGFDPDVIITSTDDPAQLLFEVAVKATRAHLVYLVRATIAVPFGPESSSVSDRRSERLRHADGVVGVSHYVADYCRKFGGLDAVHVPISLLEPERPQLVGCFDNRYVLMVNPCSVKGIDILLGLSERSPEVVFGAVPTWGTTARDMEALRRHANIQILQPVDNIDDLLRQTRVMLVPSVWAEARSRMILESMSRGIPVMASDVGGIHEAMMGVDYLLPVNQVTGYRPTVDEHMVPVADVPPQNIEPWVKVLHRLTTDREHWESISRRSREAALDYMDHLTAKPFEDLLKEICSRPKRGTVTAEARKNPLEGLSEEKKRLLALRLKQRTGAPRPVGSQWFPGAEAAPPGSLRLFCFPYAGGGTMPYKSWQAPLETTAFVCPVRLPGRESRLADAPVESMESLVGALADEIQPLLDSPFAFFGHSMGGVVAFELARELRRRGRPLPKVLIASAARAPKFRLNHQPRPPVSEAEFLEEIRRLEGMPADVLSNPELLKLALPALCVDARLYDRYVYTPDEPLPLPIQAYGGERDPNVTREHLEAWREQAARDFGLRVFTGGHFYLLERRDQLLQAIDQDLRSA